ncbi:MAG: hypothetical protein KC410_17195 [Anaerolineales bacterium]|uniref:hypothetical protein n=1 Tax=Promineifilum sp. TaxID=2664178 RepID=UPI001DC8C60C|nr:hypothetical protein [Anaerolineales bacterium]MCB8936229.1 hypothetical protein [Promineifilum sp.]MCO5181833.1 hypothetical protein [Promineifilum sp.]
MITWLIIFAILVGSGLLTILLPSFFGGGSSTSLPSDPTIVTFPLPVPIGGRSEITLASWQWMLGLAVLIPGLVIGAGLTLGIIYIILSRLATNATSSTAYQKNVAALEKKESEKISKLRETRPTSVAPESTWNRWAVITTGITIAMFVAFLTLLLASLLFPGGQVVRNDAIVNATSALVFIAVAIALTAVGLWFRSERITAINRTESLAIPWDFLAIVFSGLLVVGLGIGVIVILNAPQ